MRMTFGDVPIGDKQGVIAFLHAAVDRGIPFPAIRANRVLVDLHEENLGATAVELTSEISAKSRVPCPGSQWSATDTRRVLRILEQ
jgi:hypothetical protein